MKKYLCLGLFCMFISGCTAKLDESYHEDTLKERTMEVVELLNDEKYEEITAMGDATLNNPDFTLKVKDAWSGVAKEFGSFKEFNKFEFVGKDGNATVVAIASYENNKVQFTVSFNSNMQLIGLYFK